MGYTKTNWVDNTTPLSAANMNNLETQYDEAMQDVEASYVSMTVQLDSSTDLNTVTTSGFYRLQNSNTNAPSGIDYGQLIVSRGSDTIFQIVTGFNNNEYYMRQGSGIGATPTWQLWRKLWHDGDAATIVTSVNGNSGAVTIQGDSTASGTWTPANGSMNVPVGTVINIASVPNGAKMYSTYTTGGTQTTGGATQSGSFWVRNYGNVNTYTGHSNGISSTTIAGYDTTIYDGSYYGAGYFQINSGYLQFIVTAVSSSSNSTDTLYWAVS